MRSESKIHKIVKQCFAYKTACTIYTSSAQSKDEQRRPLEHRYTYEMMQRRPAELRTALSGVVARRKPSFWPAYLRNHHPTSVIVDTHVRLCVNTASRTRLG